MINKRNKYFKIVLCFLTALALIAAIPVASFADDTEDETEVVYPDAPLGEGSTSGSSGTTTGEVITSTGIEDIGASLPVTTTDDILNWATTKGNEIIYMLQILCQPIAILIFIIAAFMSLIGCIGKGDLVGKGVWGMIMAVIVYAVVLYAPVILQTFVGWVES